MLSSSMLREEVDVIIELLGNSKNEEAKQRIQLLTPQIASEYGRGAVLALNGVLSMATKRAAEAPEAPKIARTIERLAKTQITDDIDRGYVQTMTKWTKQVKSRAAENATQA